MSDTNASPQQHYLEERILTQKWFYRFQLPSGRMTEIYIPDEIEHTRNAGI